MRAITNQDVESCINQSTAKRNLRKNIRPNSSLSVVAAVDWMNLDFIAIPSRNNKEGILIIDLANTLYAAPYELSPLRGDSESGRLKPVICDFCRTWQTGSRAASISFHPDPRSVNSIGFLCCADLKCSLHVRDKTADSKTSRSQLRENLTTEERIQRLQNKLEGLIKRLQLAPISISN